MLKINILISQRHKKEKRMELCTITFDQLYSDGAYKYYYYIRLYFTVFLLARTNTRDIPFSNILISKKQFLCNKKAYCTLVQNQ